MADGTVSTTPITTTTLRGGEAGIYVTAIRRRARGLLESENHGVKSSEFQK